jgi:hypothetical protein
MRATGTVKLKPAVEQATGDVPRALWAGGLMVGVCGLATIVAIFVHTPASVALRSSPAAQGDLSTGSMLTVSPNGTRCSQGTIDNSTWQIHNQEWIDCDTALARAASAGIDYRPTGGTRLDMIRDSFRSSTGSGK